MEFFIEFQAKSAGQDEGYSALAKILGKIHSGVSIVFPEQVAGLGPDLSDSQSDAILKFCRTYSEFLSSIEAFQLGEDEMKLTIVGGWDTPDACRDLKLLLAELDVATYELQVSN